MQQERHPKQPQALGEKSGPISSVEMACVYGGRTSDTDSEKALAGPDFRITMINLWKRE